MANNTKQQAINTFTGGLNTDLHPLTTPNDILTDCINGTVITYNGNEYILQNDMGNYKLDKAKLYADYIPIGIKEYGNIIYIVSYNPIDKKCQIGSYPSPQTLFDNSPYGSKNEQYQGVMVYELDPNWTWPTNPNYLLSDGIVNLGGPNEKPLGEHKTDVLFTNTKPYQNLRVFFPADGLDLKDTFLNPGDKYYLKKEEGEDSNWKFQRCEYYTLTESKEVLPIEEGLVISDPDDYTPEKLRNVTWETPGWLAYKPSLIEPASFDLYLTDIKIPSFLTSTSTRQTGEGTGELSFNVQGQLTINTTGAWTGYYDNLKVYFDYSYAGNNWENDWDNGSHVNSEEKGIPTNYGNTIDILTFNNKKSLPILKEDIKDNKTVVIRATPYIIDENYGIVYDNLTVTYTINLSELYSINEINAFSTYKYLSDDDGVTINFSIVSPTSNLNQITCKYRIHEILDNFMDVGRNTGYTDIDSLNLLGQNILTLEYNPDKKFPWLQKEEIYIFELGFFDIKEWEEYTNKKTDTIVPKYQVGEFLITSSLLNDYYSNTNEFQTIPLTTWTSQLKKYTQVPKTLTQNVDKTKTTLINSFAKTYTLDSVLTSTYYTDETLISDIGASTAELKDYEIAGEKVLSKEENINASIYYGTVSSNISKLNYTIEAPSILTDSGIWKNIVWQNSSNFYHQSTTNNFIKTLNDGGISKELTRENPIEYDNVKTVFSNTYFTNFTARSFPGKDGERWYMYKNLMFGINDKDSNNWKVNAFLRYFTDIYPWVTSIGEDSAELAKLKSKNLVGIGYPPRVAFTPYGYAQNNHRTELRLALNYGELNYDYSSLTLRDREKWDTAENTASSKEAVDSFFTSKDIPWTFIPVAPATGKYYSSGRWWDRGWEFPDFGFSAKSGSQPTNSSCICIQCIDGTTKSLAAINFFPALYSKEDLRGDYNTTGGKHFTSAWLVSTTKGTLKSGLPLPQLNNKMSSCVSALLFGLGIHIFGFISLKDVSKSYIENTGSTQNIFSNSQFSVWATRNDVMKSLTYKNIDLLNTKVSKNSLEDLFKKINIQKYSIENLQGTFSKVSVETTTNKSLYIDNTELLDTSLVCGSFINYLSTSLTTLINTWSNSLSYKPDRAYTDLVGSEDIENNVKGLVENIKFEYKNGRGYFYYNGLPENVIYSRRGDDGTKTTCLRGLDWSGTFSWERLPKLFIPTADFKTSEGL